ncbi:MAG: heme exporter protein CcmD [Rhodospirillaceae bacterium]|nr:heme exporter protein CcmD [Rhodospirillaceae bacterium]
MNSVETFLAMGGYGAYIWPAYGVALVVLAAIWIDGVWRRREIERQLRALEGQSRSARGRGGIES